MGTNYTVQMGRSVQLQDGSIAYGGQIVSAAELGVDRPGGADNIASSCRRGFIEPVVSKAGLSASEEQAVKDSTAYTKAFSRTPQNPADSCEPLYTRNEIADLQLEELNALIEQAGAGAMQETKKDALVALLSLNKLKGAPSPELPS